VWNCPIIFVLHYYWHRCRRKSIVVSVSISYSKQLNSRSRSRFPCGIRRVELVPAIVSRTRCVSRSKQYIFRKRGGLTSHPWGSWIILITVPAPSASSKIKQKYVSLTKSKHPFTLAHPSTCCTAYLCIWFVPYQSPFCNTIVSQNKYLQYFRNPSLKARYSEIVL